MTPCMRMVAAVVAFAATSVASAAAAVPDRQPRLDPQTAIEQSRRAIGRTLGDYRLIDSRGAALPLRDYRGKPLVISLVYTACSSVCPTSTQHLLDAVAEANRIFGSGSFNVLTVGFDTRNDTPGRLTQFAAAQGIRSPNWRLASGDGANIAALLGNLGFSYATIAGGFDHVTQTTIVDSEGKIYRHVYGDDFPLTMFIEPMKELIYGVTRPLSLGGLLDRIKFICTVYDPGAGRYRIDYGLTFGSVIAGVSLLVFGGLLYREWSRSGHA